MRNSLRLAKRLAILNVTSRNKCEDMVAWIQRRNATPSSSSLERFIYRIDGEFQYSTISCDFLKRIITTWGRRWIKHGKISKEITNIFVYGRGSVTAKSTKKSN